MEPNVANSCSKYYVSYFLTVIHTVSAPIMNTTYRHEILTSELEKEKLFRFSHISIGNVGKTE